MVLPEAEFSYIGRPWETFTGRWAAIKRALLEELPSGRSGAAGPAPTLIDLGSNNGYFSLQAAHLLPRATVVGVEGAVGVGNGTMGTHTNRWRSLCQTTAIQTHLRWVQQLGIRNCLLAPEVWDYNHVLDLAQRGLRADAMLSLSVVHHIDEYSSKQYEEHESLSGAENKVEAFLQLLRRLLEIADLHLMELPDSPWISHVHDAFQNSPQKIFEAACQRTRLQWEMRKVYESGKWIGHREVWVLRRQGTGASSAGTSPSCLSFFPVLLPPLEGEADGEVAEVLAEALKAEPLSVRRSVVKAAPEEMDLGPEIPAAGSLEFAREALLGTWENSQGRLITILEASEAGAVAECWVRYEKDNQDGGGEVFPLSWRVVTGLPNGGHWLLCNHMGQFMLTRATSRQLCWEAMAKQRWSTTWRRQQT